MVFPLYDDNSDRTLTPFVNYAIIALNVFVFFVPQGIGQNEEFTFEFAMVPEKVWTGQDFQRPAQIGQDPITGEQFPIPAIPETPVPVYFTLLTSMFLHGGLLHLLGNMWFLWIFGDNVENYLGHLRYAFYYLACGLLAGLAHVLTTFALNGDPFIPSLGASGAISGVLGGYVLLYPFRRVTVFLFRFLVTVPAYIAIGLWFVLQLISGIGLLGGQAQVGGVAYGAHIGGFLAGLVLVKFFGIGSPGEARELQPQAEEWSDEQRY